MPIFPRIRQSLAYGALALIAAGWASQSAPAASAYAYTPITPTLADATVTLLEAAAEGIAVYWFNRGAGDQRETVMFEGDPTSA